MDHYAEIIKLELDSRKSRNPHYSLRAFAQFLGMSSGALSEIIQKKRRLGLRKGLEVVEKLNLGPEEKDQFIDLLRNQKTDMTTNHNSSISSKNLAFELIEFVSSPACTAIFALSDLHDFELEINYIKSKLEFKEDEIKSAINTMESIGLIESKGGERFFSQDFVFSPDVIPSRAIKNYHHKMLLLAQKAIDEQELERRNVMGLTFAVDENQLPKIKKEIDSFHKRIIKKYQSGKKNRVYHFESALFEMTKEEL
jgi:uncharacterized protein (TIGR02147 family)